jgi:secondary thiamine-phosphate synthase enzyme
MILTVESRQHTEMIDITDRLRRRLSDAGFASGVCMVFVPHTTAGVAINENADPGVRDDILKVLNGMVPWEADYRHMEGNSPAHVKATLTGASEMVAVENGKLVLGRWQGIFFCEFDGPRTRKVHLRFLGEARNG